MFKKSHKKTLSLVTAAIMCLSAFSANAVVFAEENDLPVSEAAAAVSTEQSYYGGDEFEAEMKKLTEAVEKPVLKETRVRYGTPSVEITLENVMTVPIEDCIAYVNSIEASEKDQLTGEAADVISITELDQAVINRVLEHDYAAADGELSHESSSKLSSYTHSIYYFYAQLNDKQRQAYDLMYDACVDFESSSVTLSTPYFATVHFNSSLTHAEYYQLLKVFFYENPQFYFLSIFSTYAPGSTHYDNVMLSAYTQCWDASNRSDIGNYISEVTDNWVDTLNGINGDFAKEELLARMIAITTTYKADSDSNNSYDQSILGALYFGECICAGYANTMNYFCNAIGIPCITVRYHSGSDGHAWNMVYIENNWYESDITWFDADPGSYDISDYAWINKSHNTFVNNDSSGYHTYYDDLEYYYMNMYLPNAATDDPMYSPMPYAYTGPDYLDLYWYPVNGAEWYNIYTYDSGYLWYQGSVQGINSTVVSADDTPYFFSLEGLQPSTTYGIVIQAYGNGVYSDASGTYARYHTTEAAPQKLSAPEFTLTPGNSQVTINWNSVSGAAGYNVYSYDSGYFWYQGSTTDTSFTVGNLVNGVEYGFVVQAYDNYGNGSDVYWYMAKTATPWAPSITAPEFYLTPGDSQVTISWYGVSGAAGYNVYSYDSGYFWYQGSTTNTSFTVSNLVNGVEYGFVVQAYDYYGNGSDVYWWMAKTATPMPSVPAPTGLCAYNSSNGTVNLYWNSVPGADYYIVYSYDSGYYWMQGTTQMPWFTVYNLPRGQSYNFVVQAYKGGAYSNVSNLARVTITV